MISFYPRFPKHTVETSLLDCLNRGLFPDGYYTKKVESLFREELGAARLVLTPSCTAALVMVCRLMHLEPGSEIILPSYNFPAAGNAVLLAGMTPVFCDIDPRTQNISCIDLEKRITKKTRAIIAVHYASVACDMDCLAALCTQCNLSLVEDAAQAVTAVWKDRPLGTLGRFGCYSFHATKVFSSGEGGALAYTDADARAVSLYRENGTNREEFLQGGCSAYSWNMCGESIRMSELAAAVLCPQLEDREETIAARLRIHRAYDAVFSVAARAGRLFPMFVPEGCGINGHIYYVRFRCRDERNAVQAALREKGITSMTHYVPLHLSPMGASLGYAPDDLPESRKAYETLLRLPIHEEMSVNQAVETADIILRAVGL